MFNVKSIIELPAVYWTPSAIINNTLVFYPFFYQSSSNSEYPLKLIIPKYFDIILNIAVFLFTLDDIDMDGESDEMKCGNRTRMEIPSPMSWMMIMTVWPIYALYGRMKATGIRFIREKDNAVDGDIDERRTWTYDEYGSRTRIKVDADGDGTITYTYTELNRWKAAFLKPFDGL